MRSWEGPSLDMSALVSAVNMMTTWLFLVLVKLELEDVGVVERQNVEWE